MSRLNYWLNLYTAPPATGDSSYHICELLENYNYLTWSIK